MASPKFTVIVPAYSRQQLLDEAVASVLGQTLPDFELIVVDDHSPIPLTVPDDPRITLIRSDQNSGKSACLNRALECARGQIIAFLDDDDAWCPHRLMHANDAHDLGPVAVCNQVDLGTGACSRSLHVPITVKSGRERARLEMPGHMNTVSVARDVCPPFDPLFRACQDIEWGIRLQQRENSLVGIESADSLFRLHDGPRHRNARRVRIGASKALLELHANHYDAHPWQKSYRHFRIAYMHFQEQEFKEAMRYALASLLLRPNRRALALVKDTVIRHFIINRRPANAN